MLSSLTGFNYLFYLSENLLVLIFFFMSYHAKHGSDSRRHSSRRGESPPRHRSRRSPSPGPSRGRSSPRPRDPKNLPESFGRVQDAGRADDDLNILQRMKTSFDNSPLADLYTYVREHKKVKIWTRNYKEVRGVMTGYIKAFDKHWNLILKDVDEVYLKPKKSKTPFLRDIGPNETLPDMPVKVPKQKKAEGEAPPAPEPVKSEEEASAKPGKKKRKKGKKSKTTSERRNINKMFIRGDNIVMICPMDESAVVEEEEEEDGEESRHSG